MASLFSDNMVLQRGQSDPVWGWTTPGAKVTVRIAGKQAVAMADAKGKWVAKLPPLPVGGPYTLDVSGSNQESAKCSNVLVGDVWVCSGQSNMEFGMGYTRDSLQEIAAANYPNIRLMVVPHNLQIDPQARTNTSWAVCTPAAVNTQNGTWNGFSAVGYFFGRELYNDLHTPIGLIQSAFGGTNAESWTSYEALKAHVPDFKPQLAQLDAERAIGAPGWAERQVAKDNAWYQQNDPGSKEGLGWADSSLDVSAWPVMALPGYWETKGVPELANFDGVVWFRREFDVPEDAVGKDITLHFAVDDDDTAWINGVNVGATDLFTVQRAYKIPHGVLKAGRNTIAIRVLDTGGGGGVYGDPSSLSLSVDGGTDIPLAGDWRYKISASIYMASAPPPLAIEANANFPTMLYNGMISPIATYGVKGVLWYQGENNANKPGQYRSLLPALIGDWRAKWGQGDFPFLIVQLAGFQNSGQADDPSWPELRDAQWNTARTVKNAGIVTAIDIGEPTDIHPKNKQEVGRRLALVARHQVYHEKIEDSGPVYQSMKTEGDTVRLTFTHTGGKMTTKNGDPLTGFIIAGADRKWLPATARIDGDTIVVSSPDVKSPVAVRYSWAGYSQSNLIGAAGLPAFPFRTDNWPYLTKE
ncbi:9-O-acetylesterase [Capsulimonas corticalis]|uniref:9-O-acetylesterase n=1 Tax=Capsulimonas corticalis TaxID=2219043 RepID=A0A402D3Z3_9BACT|nr:9-O-acetylesterase [Capsulimonas corticalis]